MNISKIRTGAKLLNKVTGDTVEVTSVDLTAKMVNAVAEDGSTISISEAESICFHYIGNDTPEPIPTFSVDPFTINGVVINTGNIKVTNVIGCMPGKVIAETKFANDTDENAKKHLFLYDALWDKFSDLGVTANTFDSESIMTKHGYIHVITANSMHTVETKDEDGNIKTETIWDDSKFVIIDDKANVSIEDSIPSMSINGVTSSIKGISLQSENKLAVAIVSDADLKSSNISNEEDDWDDEFDAFDSCQTTILQKANEATVQIFEIEYVMVQDDPSEGIWTIRNKQTRTIKAGSAVTVTIAASYDGSYLIVSDSEIVFTNNGHRQRVLNDAAAVAIARKYPVVVASKITPREVTLTLANSKLETVKVSSVSTSDRGWTTTIA